MLNFDCLTLKAFFDEMSKSDCEIWVYPVAVEAAEGDNVLCRLYLSTNEDDEYCLLYTSPSPRDRG